MYENRIYANGCPRSLSTISGTRRFAVEQSSMIYAELLHILRDADKECKEKVRFAKFDADDLTANWIICEFDVISDLMAPARLDDLFAYLSERTKKIRFYNQRS